jgi:hypothetical protein
MVSRCRGREAPECSGARLLKKWTEGPGLRQNSLHGRCYFRAIVFAWNQLAKHNCDKNSNRGKETCQEPWGRLYEGGYTHNM